MQIKTKLLAGQLKKKKSETLYSLKGIIWQEREKKSFEKNKLKSRFGITNIFANLLAMRGVNIESFKSFLSPKLKDLFPDPSKIDHVDLATKKIVEFISRKKKIGIFGDYDVDGTTSTALIGNYLKDIGVEFEFYIPDRVNEGYGPSLNAFRKLKDKSCDLILTLDCGTTSNSVINQIIKEKIEVIIVDHHQEGDSLPNALSIINPNKKKDKSNLNNLSAVGVLFFLLVSVNRELKKIEDFRDKVPNMVKYLDLVALGTICDVVKLDLINRAFVKQGLRIFNKSKNLGLNSLIRFAKIVEDINEYHLGYQIGPRINAGGRVGNSSLGAELLLTDDQRLGDVIALKLSEYNDIRKNIEKKVENEAVKKVDHKNKGIICVNSNNWHPGVIGIVASKLTERFLRPSIVISEFDDMCKGSCRSVSQFNIGQLIFDAVGEGLLHSGGGHSMAGGFSIQKSRIKDFKEYIKDKFNIKEFQTIKLYDCELTFSSIHKELFFDLEKLSPFGPGNPKPKFLIKNCFIRFPRLVGNNHFSCFVEDSTGNRLKGIFFGAYDAGVGQKLERYNGEIDLIVTIKLNNWNGEENLEIQIEDVINF